MSDPIIAKPSLWDKVKIFFTAKKAYEQISASPKSSFLTGEFWAKAAAGAVAVWYSVHPFVGGPVGVYISLGLAIWVSFERNWLKSKHLDTIVDLSNAPAYDPAAMTQVLSELVAKFPKLSSVVPTVEALADKTFLNTSASLPDSNTPVSTAP